MVLRDYMLAIRARAWSIVAFTLLGTGLGALLSFVMPVSYTTTSSVLIIPSLRIQYGTADNIVEGDGVEELMQAVYYIETNIGTYAAVAEQPALLEEAAGALQDTSLDDMRATITIDKPTDTFLVTVRAQDESIEGAEEKAHQVALALMQRVESTARGTRGAAPVDARMTDSANTTAKRSTPGTGLTVLTVATLGFYAGCLKAWELFSRGRILIQRNESASGWR